MKLGQGILGSLRQLWVVFWLSPYADARTQRACRHKVSNLGIWRYQHRMISWPYDPRALSNQDTPSDLRKRTCWCLLIKHLSTNSETYVFNVSNIFKLRTKVGLAQKEKMTHIWDSKPDETIIKNLPQEVRQEEIFVIGSGRAGVIDQCSECRCYRFLIWCKLFVFEGLSRGNFIGKPHLPLHEFTNRFSSLCPLNLGTSCMRSL